MVRVYIIDASPIFVHGLTAILISEGFRVIGTRRAASSPQCWRADVLLVDPDAAPAGQLASLVAASGLTVPVLLLGHHPDEAALLHYQDAGAAGFIDRHADAGRLLAQAVCPIQRSNRP